MDILGWMIFAVWLVGLGPSLIALFWKRLDRGTDGPVRQGRFVQQAVPSRMIDALGSRSSSSRRRPVREPPLLSVVVAARDEEERIEASLRSLLDGSWPRLEIVAIDDRSNDATGAIIDRLAAEDERLRARHVTSLPEGWLGKNHALHLGAQEARGEWLLFTDADVLFAHDALERALHAAMRRGIDHLCLMPRMISGGYWEGAFVTFFGLAFAFGTQPWLVSTRFPLAYVGVGAFNLVRRSAYEAAGGHGPIRLDVLDDIKLGRLLKRHGFRQEVLLAGEAVRVRWQNSAWGVIRGLEKNAFASLNYSLPMLLLVTTFFAVLFLLPYGALVAQQAAFLPPLATETASVRLAAPYAATLLFVHGAYGLLGGWFGGGWRVWPALPFAGLAMSFAFWRSAWITLRQGGIRWRETFYALDLLRANVYR